MSFSRHDGTLYVEDLPLRDIAERFGTPCYVYSRHSIETAYLRYVDALQGRKAMVCYAVKANANIAILHVLARLGAGFDIVSGGELQRVLAAGSDARRVVFSGVGKTEAEMRQALATDIYCFNVESVPELERLNQVALSLGKIAPVALRVNPHVDAQTHPYIATGLLTSKFGIPHEQALAVYQHARGLAGIRLCGIACHIGSQLLQSGPTAQAAQRLRELTDTLATQGITLAHIDIGGGLGVRYRDETPPTTADFLAPIHTVFAGRNECLLLEPGRSLIGQAGVLLTRVEYLKHGTQRNFAVVDAAMNDLARPALYDAWHDIVPLTTRHDAPEYCYDIVGPVCESGDFLGKERHLALAAGDLLAVLTAGAYGMAMSSNYNSRPRAAEVLVAGSNATLIRHRENITALYAGECLPPDA